MMGLSVYLMQNSEKNRISDTDAVPVISLPLISFDMH